jgi:CubicO group peptidase (beta-lactamase class C family)
MRSCLVTRRIILCLVGAFGLVVAEFEAAAQESAATTPGVVSEQPRDATSLIRPIREKYEIPGLAAASADVNGLIAVAADGVRSRGTDSPVMLNDSFHLGSCTKAMTATLLAMLVAEGQLQWTTTVGEVFTELEDGMDPQWQAVTLESLLQHRGGAPANLDANGLWGRLWMRVGTPTAQRMVLVEGVVTHPPQVVSGSKYVYSNAGYAIAGAMAERVTGQSWEELMRTKVFGPLKMTSAGFGAPGTPDVVDQPRGHTEDGEPVLPGPKGDNPPAIGPAGTVHCSIGDWTRFVQLHMEAASIRSPSLDFAEEPFNRLHNPVIAPSDPTYAMGWMVTSRPWAARTPGASDRVLTHSGSNTMWYSTVWLANDFAVLVVCNQGGNNAAKACDETARALIEDYLKHTTVSVTSPPGD